MDKPSVSYLEQWHHYLDLIIKNPFPDEDVHAVRRQREQVAKMIVAATTP